MAVYYNEFDPYAAQWLRNLIAAGHIADGEVDQRSILDVRPDDVRGFTQCHFFVGIGGWSLALRLAEWPDTRPVWTGSCPCQPFSVAGRGVGHSDERHLWPYWHALIKQCRPVVVFGEQVASAIGHGWLDLVSTDMEAEDYAIGSVVLGAHSVGAYHIRQRLWFVADSLPAGRAERWAGAGHGQVAGGGEPGVVGDDDDERLEGLWQGHQAEGGWQSAAGSVAEAGQSGYWSSCDWLPCRDGKARPVGPGTFPLAHGIPNRVGRLRAYGNAIVAPLAQIFIEEYMKCRP